MRPFVDLTGRRYGRYTVLALADRQNNHIRWLCRCDCGVEKLCKGIHLNNGLITSCGCRRRDLTIQYNTTHGLSRSEGKWTPEYCTWRNMKERCGNPNNHHYSKYGARGIFVDPSWENDYAAFFAHIGPRPSKHHSIDRIDNNGPYAPGNVRWATLQQQSMNKRNSLRYWTLDGEQISISEIAHYLGLSVSQFKWAKWGHVRA